MQNCHYKSIRSRIKNKKSKVRTLHISYTYFSISARRNNSKTPKFPTKSSKFKNGSIITKLDTMFSCSDVLLLQKKRLSVNSYFPL